MAMDPRTAPIIKNLTNNSVTGPTPTVIGTGVESATLQLCESGYGTLLAQTTTDSNGHWNVGLTIGRPVTVTARTIKNGVESAWSTSYTISPN